MGMPITIEVSDPSADQKIIDDVFSYFQYVDEKFSPFKDTSEVARINKKEIDEKDWSKDMREIMELAEETKEETDGYFDIMSPQGIMNPSGIVKGWAIKKAAGLISEQKFHTFFVDAGGDIEAHGKIWKIGIRNPFDRNQNVKIIHLKDKGIATSGTYIRGQHIYDPKRKNKAVSEIVSLTVIGPDILEADRFATAAFAMGKDGIMFIEKIPGLEGYMIDKNGIAFETSGFEKYTKQ